MSDTFDDTILDRQRQVMRQDDWNQQVVPLLPANLEQQAHTLKAFQRVRQISSASDLLRGLLACTLTTRSFRHLGIWSLLLGVADISENAWRAHLRKATQWLIWLLGELIAAPTGQTPFVPRAGIRRILLIDGTAWKCLGKGMLWRVHTAFDLLNNRIAELHVTDWSVGEHLGIFGLGPGDLVVTDRANGIRERIFLVLEKAAHIVVRISPHAFPMLTEHGQELDVIGWLKSQHARAGRIGARTICIEVNGQVARLRLLALRLSGPQQERAEKRTKRKASKQQRQLQAETLYYAGWILVVTTLPEADWSNRQVMRLYQARWHIELLFKRLKQLLDVHVLRWTSPQSVLPAIAAVLIGWALNEGQSEEIRMVMNDVMQARAMLESTEGMSLEDVERMGWDDDHYGPLSYWQVAVLSCDLLLGQIRGQITAQRVRECLPRLQRLLCSGKRRRMQDRDQQQAWLMGCAHKLFATRLASPSRLGHVP